MKTKYNELETIEDIRKYIVSTYNAHYIGGDGDGDPTEQLQVIDVWAAFSTEDEMLATLKNLANKYLLRFGKKGGKNKKDLTKAIHYITLMFYFANFDSDNIGEQ